MYCIGWRKMKKRMIGTIMVLLLSIIIASKVIPDSQKYYTSSEFGIDTIQSSIDKDQDGIDDYTDIYEGAKQYIATNPSYKSQYYKGGFPTDGYGVCTDVIWNSLKAAGYDLKSMIDSDIKSNPDKYPDIQTPDPNIDFRRVQNLNIFLKRNTQSLTTDLKQIEEWQPGDIVVFNKHIAICSAKRNKKGIPFIIHHTPKGAKEANDMKHYKIIGHYRWTQTSDKPSS